MAHYVALLRGTGPSNPNMSNDRLRSVFEDLGFGNVRTVISSGNVLFESDSTDTAAMEARLEAAWPEMLGFTSTTIIRSIKQMEALVEANPYAGLVHGLDSYLLATFFKHPPEIGFELPSQRPVRSYRLLSRSEREIFSVIDTTDGATPDLMVWLERQFGKEISSRTWLTVDRIIKKARTR